jgi:hypothetical protein
MFSAEEKLWKAAGNDELSVVLSVLQDNPGLNINWGNESQWTALHRASQNGHVEVVKVLLTHPHINVNCKSNFGWTPLSHVCYEGGESIVCVLLKDHRVNVTMTDHKQRTPLWLASCGGYDGVVELLMASGRDLGDIKNTKAAWGGKDYTVLEIARDRRYSKVVSLLESFLANPSQTRYEIRIKLGVFDELSAAVFALIVFVCDDLLQLRHTASVSSIIDQTVRFFSIATKLPMEVQMILCCRAVGSMKQNILRKDSEPAFKSLARSLLSQVQ